MRHIFSVPFFSLLFFTGCLPQAVPHKVSNLPIVYKDYDKEKSFVEKHDQVVRVGLHVATSESSLKSSGPLLILDMATNTSFEKPAGEWVITARSGGVLLNQDTYGNKIKISPKNQSDFLKVGKLKIRGSLIARSVQKSKLTLVNELDLDSYLKGVLPREVIVSWPMEALKSQAVASRTYLLSHLGRHQKDGFDVCRQVHCQVYGGMNKEHPQTSKAVEETKNEVLLYNGKPIGAFFHACCGGHTEKIGAVWGSTNKPYLPAVRCGYGKAAPWFEWSLSVSNDDIVQLLKKADLIKGNKLKSLRVKKKSRSSRAETVSVQTNKGVYNLSGNSFRLAMHPEKIRSTLWTNLSKHKNGYKFKGRGWGHGVGMCQWGARGQALQNRSYKKILAFYYPKAELRIWKH